ncbi:hypothetical protein [Dyadobacter jejuensis]|nr:hypothetical protein [Dyadobacter jejuensis]
MALLSLILLFYGGFTIKNRPQLEQQLLAAYQKASGETLKREKQRMLAEKNNHTKIQLTWGLVLLAGVASRLVLAAPYSKGIATGFALMGLFLLLTDLWALRRMNQYKISIQTL